MHSISVVRCEGRALLTTLALTHGCQTRILISALPLLESVRSDDYCIFHVVVVFAVLLHVVPADNVEGAAARERMASAFGTDMYPKRGGDRPWPANRPA